MISTSSEFHLLMLFPTSACAECPKASFSNINTSQYWSILIPISTFEGMQQSKVGFPVSEKSSFPFLWAWIPDVILFESKTISLTFELRGSLGILRLAPSTLKIFALGAGLGLGIPSEPRSSKVRLIVILSNRMTSGIHAHSLFLKLEEKD